jgi:Uma2 family endonuclease
MADGSTIPGGPRAPVPRVPVPRAPRPLGLAPYDRRILAAQIALRLAPAAWAWGGFASAEVRVAIPRHTPRRPDVAVVLGPPPILPQVGVPPLLVVELATDGDVQAWRELGVPQVWLIGGDGAAVLTAGAPARWVDSPGVLAMSPQQERSHLPALQLALPVLPR